MYFTSGGHLLFRVWLIKIHPTAKDGRFFLKSDKMALAANYVLFLSLLFGLSIPVTSQDCSLPDNSTINTNLQSLLTSVGGEGPATTTTLLDHHFTCLALASSRDQYRQVSVAVRYTKNTASEQFTAQFTLGCTSTLEISAR